VRVSCPACGAELTLDTLLSHEAARRAVATAMQISAPLADRLMKYLALFRPASRQLTMDRLATLLAELLPMIQAGQITRRGRAWATPVEAWKQALDLMLAHRDDGRLTLPLRSHGYLMEVLAGMAEKWDADAEREHHARLARGERPQRDAAPVTTGPVAVADVMPREIPAEVRAQLQQLGVRRAERAP
jgi:hypothetical protein